MTQKGLLTAENFRLGIPLKKYTDSKSVVFQILKNNVGGWIQTLFIISGVRNAQPVYEVLSVSAATHNAEKLTKNMYSIYIDDLKNIYVEVPAYSSIFVNFFGSYYNDKRNECVLIPSDVDISTLTKIL